MSHTKNGTYPRKLSVGANYLSEYAVESVASAVDDLGMVGSQSLLIFLDQVGGE